MLGEKLEPVLPRLAALQSLGRGAAWRAAQTEAGAHHRGGASLLTNRLRNGNP